ncbi:MAG: P-loop NTPase [Patescibacteria group bacterium]
MLNPSTRQKIPGAKTVIGVIGGKGGVGKTFVATSLALTLAKSGKSVALLDADINCPNIFKMLGIKTRVLTGSDNRLVPVQKWGLKVISMAGLCATEDEPVIWRGPIISKIITQMIAQSAWGENDFMVIDFPSGTGDSVVTVLQNFEIDGVIVVTTPQELSVIDARRTLNMCNLLKVPVAGILENMRGEIFGEGGANKITDLYRLPLLSSIPMRKQIVTLCDGGIPPVFNMEEIEMIFSRIVRNILEKMGAPT